MAEKLVVGVDLGGTSTKLAVINLMGDIKAKWTIPTDVSSDGKNITVDIAASINEKIAELGISKQAVIGIGMGAPGPVDTKRGIVDGAVNLGWKGEYPLQRLLEEATSLRVFIDNDANCAALGEMWKGSGSGAKELVCITLGTGVGGGVITNGEIIHGINGAGGEIGHITAIPFGGAPCNCGKTGCIETIASATGIVRIATEKLGRELSNEGWLKGVFFKNGKISAKNVLDAARAGDPLAKAVVDEVALYLGLTISHVANTLNPEKIVIGGGVSRAGDVLLNPVIDSFRKFTFDRALKSTTITIATLGNDAGVIGAAWLGKHGDGSGVSFRR
jgi:glucokinase